MKYIDLWCIIFVVTVVLFVCVIMWCHTLGCVVYSEDLKVQISGQSVGKVFDFFQSDCDNEGGILKNNDK